MFVRNCVWSGLLCSFCDIEHIIFEYLMVFFLIITSFESWNHHFAITSKVFVCYPANILSEPDYNLTVFRLSKIKVLLAVSSHAKVILIKVYRVRCITVSPVSSPPVDNKLIQKSINLSNWWFILSIRQLKLILCAVTKVWPS